MDRVRLIVVVIAISLSLYPYSANAQLKSNYYAKICPNVESIVRKVVQTKFRQTFVTAPATLRLFFHDCFVQVVTPPVSYAEKTAEASLKRLLAAVGKEEFMAKIANMLNEASSSGDSNGKADSDDSMPDSQNP